MVSSHVDNPHLYIGALCGLNILGHTPSGFTLENRDRHPSNTMPPSQGKRAINPLKTFPI